MSQPAPAWPSLTSISWDDTHRLIPETVAGTTRTFLQELAADPTDAEALTRLAASTSGRTLAQHGRLPGGPTPHELVFGAPFSKIINGAFSYPGNEGARFSLPRWGAWYAGDTVETAHAEVAFHRRLLLQQTGVTDDEMTYVDFLADIHGWPFADLRDGRASSAACLDPTSYARGQQLAEELLASSRAGVVYPSVRLTGGECVACLRPDVIANVRIGGWYELRLVGGRMTIIKLPDLPTVP